MEPARRPRLWASRRGPRIPGATPWRKRTGRCWSRSGKGTESTRHPRGRERGRSLEPRLPQDSSRFLVRLTKGAPIAKASPRGAPWQPRSPRRQPLRPRASPHPPPGAPRQGQLDFLGKTSRNLDTIPSQGPLTRRGGIPAYPPERAWIVSSSELNRAATVVVLAAGGIVVGAVWFLLSSAGAG